MKRNQSLTAERPDITLAILFMLTSGIAIVGVVAEIMFIKTHLELVARQLSLLTLGVITN